MLHFYGERFEPGPAGIEVKSLQSSIMVFCFFFCFGSTHIYKYWEGCLVKNRAGSKLKNNVRSKL